MPSSARAIQNRLEVVLQLLAQLITVVQLQHSTLLTVSRVACQTLTVAGVDLLQIKAAGRGCYKSDTKCIQSACGMAPSHMDLVKHGFAYELCDFTRHCSHIYVRFLLTANSLCSCYFA